MAPERWTPEALAALAERLNGPGAEALEKVPDAEILAAWEGAVAAFLDPRSEERRELEDRLAPSAGLSPEGLEAGLQAVLGGVRGEPAARLFADAARARRASTGAARRRGFALIVLASNLPALAVQPLLPALAARRPTLLKSPSAEPYFAPAFRRALARRLPPLGDAVAAATWPGGSEELEAPLLERAGVVLAYGDAESTASLERRAPGKVVAYGPRTSLAAVARGADPAAAAPGLARDVALFDQRGCLSVAAVYVEGSGEEVGRWAAALAEELRALARRWPPGPVDPGIVGAVQQVRLEAELRGLDRHEVTSELAAGTVVVEPNAAFQPTPGLRTLRVHPIPDLNRLPELLAPWRDRLQGVALGGNPETPGDKLRVALRDLGVSRITPPGALQHPDALWHNGGVDPLQTLLGSLAPPDLR